MSVKKSLNDCYVIDTKTRSNAFKGIDYTNLDLEACPAYKELVDLQKQRKLGELMKDEPKRIRDKAINFHTTEMLEDPNVVKYATAVDGLIPIDNLEDAVKIYKDLIRRDREIRFSPIGKDLPAKVKDELAAYVKSIHKPDIKRPVEY